MLSKRFKGIKYICDNNLQESTQICHKISTLTYILDIFKGYNFLIYLRRATQHELV